MQVFPGTGTLHSLCTSARGKNYKVVVKCSGAKVGDRGGDNKVARSGGSESLSAAHGCDWSTEVGDVRRCQSMQRLVRLQTQLELDALQDGIKAVEAVSQHSYVLDNDPRNKRFTFLFLPLKKKLYAIVLRPSVVCRPSVCMECIETVSPRTKVTIDSRIMRNRYLVPN